MPPAPSCELIHTDPPDRGWPPPAPGCHGDSRETGSLLARECADIYRQGRPLRPATVAHLILLLLPCPLRSGPGGGEAGACIADLVLPQSLKDPGYPSQASAGTVYTTKPAFQRIAQERANLNAKSGHFAVYKNICWKGISFLDYALFPYTYKHTHTCFGQCEQRKQYPQLLLACELCIHRT